MDKKTYEKNTSLIEENLKKMGFVKEIGIYGWNIHKFVGAENTVRTHLEEYEKNSKVFSIFSKFENKPEGYTNSKHNMHVFMKKLNLKDVFIYLSILKNMCE